MFEQQIEETISSIKRKTIGEHSSIPLKAVLAADIPQAVKTYFDLDVKQWMKEEHDRLLNSPHFDYSDDEVRRRFRDIELHSKPMIRFTSEEFETVLDQAVKLHFNYICRPQWTLSKFVFGEKDLVTADAILDALNYFVEYDYFKLIVAEYLQTKGYGSMHRDRFEELVATLDNEVTKGFDSRKMAHLAEPLFTLFAGSSDSALIPIEALSVFYDDKNVSPIVERLDAEKETMPMLSMHDLTVLISEVDFSTTVDISNLVNRHLYPERQKSAHAKEEPSDEELKRSILSETRAAQKAAPPAAPPITKEEEPAPEPEAFTIEPQPESEPPAAPPITKEEEPEPEAFSFEPEPEEEPETALPSFEEEEEPMAEFQPEPEPAEEPPFPGTDEEEEPLADFQIEEEQPTEEASLPDFGEEPQEEEQLPDFSFEEEKEDLPAEEEEIPSFQHVTDTGDTTEEESNDDFSFSFGEEEGEEPQQEETAESFGNFDFESGEETQDTATTDDDTPMEFGGVTLEPEEEPLAEQHAAPSDDEDMDTPEELEGFTLTPDVEPETAAAEPAEEDMDMPEEFEGFKLAPEEGTADEPAPPSGEQEVPEFSEFSTEEESMPTFADAGDIKDEEDEEPTFDDFLPVEEDTTPDTALPSQERLDETGTSADEDINLDFSLGEEAETTEEVDSFDSFLSDLDKATGDTPESPSEEGDDLTFLEGISDGTAGESDDLAFVTEEPAPTPGDEFSFDGDFQPPESDISYEESSKLVNEDQKNEYSTEDETHFNEFEFEPPDDDSLILPELDLSLDESETEMVTSDDSADGFDFGEALAEEAEQEASQNEMKDLMKDFVRDQGVGDDGVDDPVATLGDLKQTIPAKDRKLYVKTLFNKDEDAFEAALNELNRKRAWRDASEYIDELFIEHDVDMYSKVAIKFTDEIYKRYQP